MTEQEELTRALLVIIAECLVPIAFKASPDGGERERHLQWVKTQMAASGEEPE